jgi:hypothetical protein
MRVASKIHITRPTTVYLEVCKKYPPHDYVFGQKAFRELYGALYPAKGIKVNCDLKRL